MIATNNNPLGRLHNILTEILNHDNDSPYVVFSSIFNLDEDNKGSILASYSELFKLCENARNLIINLPNIKHEKLLSPITDVILALSKIDFTTTAGLRNFKNTVDSKLLSNLDLCSEMLSYTYNEKQLEESTLKELSSNVQALIDYINNTNINDELKYILLLHLNEIKVSINKYKISGVSEIKSSLTKFIGDIIMNNNLATTDEEKSVVKTVLEKMSILNTAISFKNNFALILTNIIALIS